MDMIKMCGIFWKSGRETLMMSSTLVFSPPLDQDIQRIPGTFCWLTAGERGAHDWGLGKLKGFIRAARSSRARHYTSGRNSRGPTQKRT